MSRQHDRRPAPVLFGLVIPAGAAAAAWCLFALSPGWSWLEDASDIEFAAQVSAAETEPDAVSSVASGKTS